MGRGNVIKSFKAKVLDIKINQNSSSLVETYLAGKEYSVGIFEDSIDGTITAMPIEIIVKKNSNTITNENNKEIILEAVKQNGNALKYASEDLRNDIDIVLEAVKENGVALVYASNNLKNNREIVLEAVKECGRALA